MSKEISLKRFREALKMYGFKHHRPPSGVMQRIAKDGVRVVVASTPAEVTVFIKFYSGEVQEHFEDHARALRWIANFVLTE